MLVRSSLILDTVLIDMYCKCRKVEDARRVFERMGERNLVSWNAMILGHCIRGSPEDGLGLFDVMIGMGKMKYGVESDETPRLLPDEVPSLVFSVRVLGRRCWLRGGLSSNR